MDFARKQLEKYGWKEGMGLGRNEDGISCPVKPKLKFNNHGIGLDVAKDFTDAWWEKTFNQAAGNIDVKRVNGTIHIGAKKKDLELTKQIRKTSYNTFVKTEKLTSDGMVKFKCNNVSDDENSSEPAISNLTDDQLFKACNGRTAHKGARHGLKLSGKLSRLEKQEKLLMKKFKKVSLSDEKDVIQKKIRKLTKHIDRCQISSECESISATDDASSLSPTNSISSKKKKKKNKFSRRVSFNEIVTVYQTPAQDFNPVNDNEIDSDRGPDVIIKSKVKDGNSNVTNNEDSNIADEGIVQDLDGYFSDGVASIALVLGTSKSGKRTRKRQRMHQGATARFLKEMGTGIDAVAADYTPETCSKCKKPKLSDFNMFQTKFSTEFYEPQRTISKKLEKKIKHDEKQLNSIVKSLNKKCTISES